MWALFAFGSAVFASLTSILGLIVAGTLGMLL